MEMAAAPVFTLMNVLEAVSYCPRPAGAQRPSAVSRLGTRSALSQGGSPGAGLVPFWRVPVFRRSHFSTWTPHRAGPESPLHRSGKCTFKLTEKGPGLWGLTVETFLQLLSKHLNLESLSN